MKIKHGPQEIEVDPIEIVKAEEPWCEYVLADGTKIKVKHVLGAVFRAKDVYTDSDDPLYVTRSQNVVIASDVPEALKRKG
jgi:hypothetical protein